MPQERGMRRKGLERGTFSWSLPGMWFQILLDAGFCETLFQCCVIGQGTLHSHASLYSDVNAEVGVGNYSKTEKKD